MTQQSADVDERMEMFVQNFVQGFETYFKSKYEQLTEGIAKSGKTVALLEKLCGIGKHGGGMLEGGGKTLALVALELLLKGPHLAGAKYNHKQTKKLAQQLFHFIQNPEDVREKLVEGACQIFMNFEAQFMNMSADSVWQRAVQKVAHDAVCRVIDYLKDHPEDEISVTTVCKGVIHGQSKRSKNFWKEGHGITLGDRDIRTPDMFNKLGVKFDDKFYTSKGNDYPKAGIWFRLAFEWENISSGDDYIMIQTGKTTYKLYKCAICPTNEYKYVLTQEHVKGKYAMLLSQIDDHAGENLEIIQKEIQNAAKDSANSIIQYIEDQHEEIIRFFNDKTEIFDDLKTMSKRYVETVEEVSAKIDRQDEKLDRQDKKLDEIRECVKEPEKSEGTDLEPMRFSLTRPVDSFTGREQQLKDLNDLVHRKATKQTLASQITVISGMGGVGKTQLARYYAQKYCQQLDVLWFDASRTDDSRDSFLESSFVDLAKDFCKIPTTDANGKQMSISSVVQKVYKFFTRRAQKRGCVMFFDNAEKPSDLRTFLPDCEASPQNTTNEIRILITSRYQDWDPDIGVLPLKEFEPQEAVNLVKEGLKQEDVTSQSEMIQQLVKTLQYFPLALEQAVACIRDRAATESYTVGDYVQEYQTNAKELLEDETFCELLGNQYKRTTCTTWNMTLKKILEDEKYGKLAMLIMNVIAFIAPDNIQRDIFYSEDTKHNVHKAVQLLVRHSMLKGEEKQSVLSVHRLVQEVIRLKLGQLGSYEETITETSGLLIRTAESYPQMQQQDKRMFMKKRLPHLEAFLVHLERWYNRNSGNEVLLRTNMGGVLEMMREGYTVTEDVSGSEFVLLKLLEIKRMTEGENSYEVASILRHLEDLYRSAAMYPDAVREGEEALTIFEQVGAETEVGEQHFRAALSYSDMGSLEEAQACLHGALGKFNEALKDDEFKLTIWKLRISNTFEDVHDPKTAGALRSATLPQIEKHKEKLNEISPVEILEVGQFYLKLGEFPEAAKCFEMSLEKYEAEFGRESRGYQSALEDIDLGLEYALEDAVVEEVQNMKSIQQERQTDHRVADPWKLLIQGMIHQENKEYDQSIQAGEEAVKCLRDHSHMMIYRHLEGTTLIQLGEVYLRKGDFQMALARAQEGLAALERLHGPRSTSLLRGLSVLRKVHESLGNFHQVRDLLEREFRIWVNLRKVPVFGPQFSENRNSGNPNFFNGDEFYGTPRPADSRVWIAITDLSAGRGRARARTGGPVVSI